MSEIENTNNSDSVENPVNTDVTDTKIISTPTLPPPLPDFDTVIKADPIEKPDRKKTILKIGGIVLLVVALVTGFYFLIYENLVNKKDNTWETDVLELIQEINTANLNIAAIQELVDYYDTSNTINLEVDEFQLSIDEIKESIAEGVGIYEEILIPEAKTISEMMIVDEHFLDNLRNISFTEEAIETQMSGETLIDEDIFTINYTSYSLIETHKKFEMKYPVETIRENIESFKYINSLIRENASKFINDVINEKDKEIETSISEALDEITSNNIKSNNVIKEIKTLENSFNNKLETSEYFIIDENDEAAELKPMDIDLTDFEERLSDMEDRSLELINTFNLDDDDNFVIINMEAQSLLRESTNLLNELNNFYDTVKKDATKNEEILKTFEEEAKEKELAEITRLEEEELARQAALEESIKTQADKDLEALKQWEKEQAEREAQQQSGR